MNTEETEDLISDLQENLRIHSERVKTFIRVLDQVTDICSWCKYDDRLLLEEPCLTCGPNYEDFKRDV